MVINPHLSWSLMKITWIWEWCEVGFTSVTPKDQLCGDFQSVSIQTAGKTVRPQEEQARGSPALQLSAKLGTCRCSLQPWSHSSAPEGVLPNLWEPLTIGRPWADSTEMAFASKIPIKAHRACSLCVWGLILCVCAQTTKGCISWPSSVPAPCFHFVKKKN